MTDIVLTTEGLIPGHNPITKGKVRDIYDLGDSLLIVATDRISTYDSIHPNGIPDKGKILTEMTLSWLRILSMANPHHLMTANVREFPDPFNKYPGILAGRSMLVRKAKVIPVECVIRGYLYGPAFKEYKETQCVSGYRLWPNLVQAQKFQNPLFTPATKARLAHDENLTMSQFANNFGLKLALELERRTRWIYQEATRYAERRGVIIADTKLEFGFDKSGQVILIDEILTPDSSRYWLKDSWKPGQPQEALDKQYVRDYVDSINWDHNPPAPELSEDVVEKTREKYLDIKKRLFEPI